ncbi:GNAT family N-acetyltransferase [Amorphus sp. 3PC139-8]|uniref:GNAT family N-acetyltransferase n=1 Tax=Amorphus sp. 3PC139-8 TaxID=2735676 RepID=UPI00345C6EE7
MPTISAAGPTDRREWERLWAENCAHFKAGGMTGAVVDGLWQRILDPASPMQAWLAVRDNRAIGLAHTILHPHTFSFAVVCLLEDLWVTPKAQGQGVATKILAHLEAVGRQQGWRRLCWETDVDNMPARRLYDRIATRRPTVTYRIELNG